MVLLQTKKVCQHLGHNMPLALQEARIEEANIQRIFCIMGF